MQIYWNKVKSIAKANNIDTISARNFYNTVERIGKARFTRILAKTPSQFPARIRKAGDVWKYSKASTRRSEKGKLIVYYDTLTEKLVTGVTALKFRRELQVERAAHALENIPWSKQRAFQKYWDKRSRDKKKLTPAAAKKVAAKVLKDRFGNKRLFSAVLKIFGGSP